MLSPQAPAAVVMIRPHHFRPNPATLDDNSFQSAELTCSAGQDTAQAAWQEVTSAAQALAEHGVDVHVFEDLTEETPDSVFPNNWFTTHSDGTVVLYPMYTANRQRERREDVIHLLKERYQVQRVLDLAQEAQPGTALEGTGAMVLDHVARIAFVCRSRRADPALVQRFCDELGYEAIIFDAADRGEPVYHTNVMMAVGTTFAVVGAELISDPDDRRRVLEALETSGREVIELSREQIRHFAGNCLELATPNEPLLALSRTAYEVFSDVQRTRLEGHVSLLPLAIPTLEAAGGSVRCTLAGIHLALDPAQGSIGMSVGRFAAEAASASLLS